MNLIQKTKLKYIILLVVILAVYLGSSGKLNYLQYFSVKKQWRAGQILDYRNSVYGNVAVTKRLEQYTFFYNGIPVITTPYPDITFVEELGNLPLLFHRAPKDILVISAGAGGLINQILKHPIRKLDYVELDPLIIEMVKKYPTRLTESELADRRVEIINLDGRFFLKTNPKPYDIVLIGLSNQSNLSTNRLFTQEFFSLVKERLNSEGILAFWLPGSLTYIGQELRDLNICVLNALKNTYDYVRIIPGDYNIYLASSSWAMMNVDSNLIWQRMNQQNIKTNILTPAYLDYRLNKSWLDWFNRTMAGGTQKINQDFKPFAVFEMLIFWNKQFSPKLYPVLASFGDLSLRGISLFLFLITLLFFYIFYRNRRKKLAVAYSIATTGFFGMLASLILIFSFQIYFGYLYYRIGILISIFMAGTALGSISMTAAVKKIKKALSLFIKLEVLIILFSYIIALTITKLLLPGHYVSLTFLVLFFVSGLLIGLEFPLASKIYLGSEGRVGETSGVLYASDLIGGWVAGVLGGIILLPVLGLFNTCIIIIMLKLSSLLLLIFSRDTLN